MFWLVNNIYHFIQQCTCLIVIIHVANTNKWFYLLIQVTFIWSDPIFPCLFRWYSTRERTFSASWTQTSNQIVRSKHVNMDGGSQCIGKGMRKMQLSVLHLDEKVHVFQLSVRFVIFVSSSGVWREHLELQSRPSIDMVCVHCENYIIMMHQSSPSLMTSHALCNRHVITNYIENTNDVVCWKYSCFLLGLDYH